MSHPPPTFTVVQGGAGNQVSAGLVDSPDIPPLIALDTSERRVWKYICESLKTAGLEHVTAGLPIAVIVRDRKSTRLNSSHH